MSFWGLLAGFDRSRPNLSTEDHVARRVLRAGRGGGPCQDLGRLQSGRIGIELSEEYPLHPEQSTDEIVVHHLEAEPGTR